MRMKTLNLKTQLKAIDHLCSFTILFKNRLEHKISVTVFLFTILTFSVNVIFVEAQEFEEYGVKVETVAEDLEIPWAISFAPDGRIFFTERVGSLRVIEDGKLNSEPVIILDVGKGEGGLLGLALDPNFEENHYLYLYYTYSELLSTYNKVVRFTENDNKLSDEMVLIDKIPGASWHDGGRIKFGPDEKLYITTGDAGNADSSQDLGSPSGKILRINSDGSIPEDNPFKDSPVYSLGHRNPQGLDWDNSGKLVSSEHGPSGDRGGARAHDEVNVIESGKNYGWPKVIGGESDPQFIDPIIHTGDETWAPSGASFYKSENIPEWTNNYFIATLRGNHLRMLNLDLEKNEVISSDALFEKTFGRLRDASMGPDGNLYLLTSNQDGRGSPAENDDRILRIVPLTKQAEKIPGDSSISPLKQYEAGVKAQDVKCKSGFELVIKSSNGVPACVKPSTALKLVTWGWGIK